MSARVSVVLPVKDGADHVASAIERVLRQTYAQLELIVVDDGSTDATASIVRSVQDSRVHLVQVTPSGGVAHARNVGIEHASGDLLWFVDVDDRWSDDIVEQFVRRQSQGDVDVVICGARFVYGTDAGRGERLPGPRGTATVRGDAVVRTILQGTGALWNKAFRREVVAPGTFPAQRSKSDHAGLLRMLPRIGSVGLVDADLYTYVRTDGSISNARVATPGDFLTLVPLLHEALERRGGAHRFRRETFLFTHEVYARTLREVWRHGERAQDGQAVERQVRESLHASALLRLVGAWDWRIAATCGLSVLLRDRAGTVFRAVGRRRWVAAARRPDDGVLGGAGA